MEAPPCTKVLREGPANTPAGVRSTLPTSKRTSWSTSSPVASTHVQSRTAGLSAAEIMAARGIPNVYTPLAQTSMVGEAVSAPLADLKATQLALTAAGIEPQFVLVSRFKTSTTARLFRNASPRSTRHARLWTTAHRFDRRAWQGVRVVGRLPAALRISLNRSLFDCAAAVLQGSGRGFVHSAGMPWNNGQIESFNNRLRKECLNRNHSTSLLEARLVIEDF